ncbi:MAG: hypothetical protein N3B10_04320 [Armatimonadetes bacterium]|nr:hypothetical protein [Armatimonadota bacterium]
MGIGERIVCEGDSMKSWIGMGMIGCYFVRAESEGMVIGEMK